MLRFHSLLVVGLLSCCLSAACQNGNTAGMKLFQARYDALTKAYLAKDVAAAGPIFANDYSAGDYSNPLDKQKTLDALRHWDRVFRTTSRKVIAVNVNGNKATVIVNLVTEGKMADSKGTHTYVIKSRTFDTWVKNGPGWQLKHSRVIQKSVTKDGKQLPQRLGG